MTSAAPSVKRPNFATDAEGPHRLRVEFERGLKGSTISRKAWPNAEVAVNIDTRSISIRVSKRESHEFPIQDCTFHHSRLTTGCLGVCFKSRDCQLLFRGRPESARRLFQELIAATEGCRKPVKGCATSPNYKQLAGVPSKRRRLSFIASGRPSVQPQEAPKRLPPEIDARLTDEQRNVCQAALRGESFFFTGGAGTGKSFLLQQLLRLLPQDVTAVTAPTALAASHLGGTTLHKWAGIGRGEGDVLELAKELRGRREALQRWRRAKTLVIDEVSMVDGQLFDKLEILARGARRCDKPFGGLQLILAGDFMQLPPVNRAAGGGADAGGFGGSGSATFCFEARSWKTMCRTFELTQVFRQREDLAFCQVLEEARFGRLSEQSQQLLATRLVAGHCVHSEAADVTRLMPLRKQVENINERALAALPGDRVYFDARDQGNAEELDVLSGARRIVELRVGAAVILTRTLDARRKLVNGSQGRVTGFSGHGSMRHPVVAFKAAGVEVAVSPEAFEARCGSRVLGVRVQVPLELAWALSIHKSQGMTLSAVEVSLETVFEYGQAYVAMSRAQSLAGLYLIGDATSLARSVQAEQRCVAFHERVTASSRQDVPKDADGQTQPEATTPCASSRQDVPKDADAQTQPETTTPCASSRQDGPKEADGHAQPEATTPCASSRQDMPNDGDSQTQLEVPEDGDCQTQPEEGAGTADNLMELEVSDAIAFDLEEELELVIDERMREQAEETVFPTNSQ